MRLVLDTNVLVAAFRSPRGASARLVEAALDAQFGLLVSVPLFLEYEAVLLRPEHLTAAKLSADEMGLALTILAQISEPVDIHFALRPLVRDPNDDMVAEAAVNGRADGLVTFEAKVFDEALRQYSVDVMTPANAWRMVKP